MYTSNKITGFFILIAINPNPFLSSPLTKLSSQIYEINLPNNQPGGLNLNFGCCHKIIIIANCQVINEPNKSPYPSFTSIPNLSLLQSSVTVTLDI